jgi:hypothetical protein
MHWSMWLIVALTVLVMIVPERKKPRRQPPARPSGTAGWVAEERASSLADDVRPRATVSAD